MVNQQYASYEKQVTSLVVRERHIVRIALNETKKSLIETLEIVPDSAIITMIIGDSDCAPDIFPTHGEIYFDNEYTQ